MAIILQEALRGLFYAPFYVALARDAFAAEGVEIRFTSSPHPNETALRVMDGTVDVCWGGPMRVMETYHKLPGCDLVCFGEVVTRDPFLLMGRTPKPDFTLADLASVTLATVSEVPTPWLCLQHDLRLAGIDPAGIRRVDRPDDGREHGGAEGGHRRRHPGVRAVPQPAAGRGRGARLVRGGAAGSHLLHLLLRAARHAGVAARRAFAPGAGDRPHREVGGEGRRPRDRQRDRGLLRRCSARDPRGGLHALQGARHLGRRRRSCRAPATTGCATGWCPAASFRQARPSRPLSTTRWPRT